MLLKQAFALFILFITRERVEDFPGQSFKHPHIPHKTQCQGKQVKFRVRGKAEREEVGF